MSVSIGTLVGAVAASALINLDRQTFGPFMLSRPLVSGLLVGVVLGCPTAGLTIGLWTELLWLAVLPLGGHIPPNGGLAVSLMLTAYALAVDAQAFSAESKAGLLAAFVLVAPVARLATVIERLSRRFLRPDDFSEKDLAADGYGLLIFLKNLKGLSLTFGLTLVVAAVFTPVGAALIKVTAQAVPPECLPVINRLYPLIPLAGLMIMAASLPKKMFSSYLAAVAAGLFVLSSV